MDEIIDRWRFVRSETLELLDVLNDEQLLLKPEGDTWQPMYYQFACIARTQLVYAKAAESGVMDFGLFASPLMPNKHDYQTKEQLIELLNMSEDDWKEAVDKNTVVVKWPDAHKSIEVHVMSLAEHERLHHGQLISYFTLLGIELPRSFKRNWAL